MEQPISASPAGRGPRVTLRAGLGFAIVLVLLFHRLLIGEVLSPAAISGYYPLFQTSRHDAVLNSNPFQWDVWTQVIPWEFEQYRHPGGVPMWDPHIYCGFPVFANGQSEFLNPTHWIYYFANPDFARGPMAALRLWVSAMAMFLLLRRYGIGGAGAFLGGTVWILCGFNIRWLLWAHTDASLTLPLILLALDCYLCQPTARRWAVVGLTATFLALSGHVAMQMMVGIVVALFLLVRLAAQWTEGVSPGALARRLLGCAAGLATGWLAAAAQFLPQIKQILGSYELAKGDRGTFPLPLKALWLFVSPNIFGWTRGEHFYTGPSNYFEASAWFGLVALALALAAGVGEFRISDFGFRIWKKEIRNLDFPRWLGGFAILLVLISLLLAFGVLSYLLGVRANPVVRNINFIRMFMGVGFGGAILAAMGADQILRRRSRPVAWLTCFFMAVALVAGTMLFFHSEQLQFLRSLDYGSGRFVLLNSAFRVVGGLVIAGLACVVLGAIAWSMRRGQGSRPAWQVALIAVAVADLLWVAWDFNSTSPRELVLPPLPRTMRDIIARSGDGRILAGTIWTLTPNLASMYDFRDVRGYDLPKSFRLGNLMEKLHLNTIYGAPATRESLAPVMDARLASWLDRCSVRFILLGVGMDRVRVARPANATAATPEAQPWPLVARMPACFAYANPNAYPRAFMPAQARLGTTAAALAAMLDPALDLRRETIYESDHGALDQADSTAASGTVHVTLDQDEEVELKVQTSTGGMVVLQDRMEPGWTVTVDGVEAIPLTTNYLYRGVHVPSGSHVVRWTYRTPGLAEGSIISALTLLILFGLVIPWPKRAQV